MLTSQAAYLKNNGMPVTLKSSYAKLYASEACVYCAIEAIQIMGGMATLWNILQRNSPRFKLMTIGEVRARFKSLSSQEILRSRFLVLVKCKRKRRIIGCAFFFNAI